MSPVRRKRAKKRDQSKKRKHRNRSKSRERRRVSRERDTRATGTFKQRGRTRSEDRQVSLS